MCDFKPSYSSDIKAICCVLGIAPNPKSANFSAVITKNKSSNQLMNLDKSLILQLVQYLNYRSEQSSMNIVINNSIEFKHNQLYVFPKNQRHDQIGNEHFVKHTNDTFDYNALLDKSYNKIKKDTHKFLIKAGNNVSTLTEEGVLCRYNGNDGIDGIDGNDGVDGVGNNPDEPSLTFDIDATNMVLSPDGKIMAIKCPNTILVINYDNLESIMDFKVDDDTEETQFTFSPDSSQLIAWAESYIFLYNIGHDSKFHETKNLYTLKYTSNDTICTIQSRDDDYKTVTIFDNHLVEMKSFQLEKQYISKNKWSLSKDTSEFITGKKRNIYVINPDTGTIMETVNCHEKVKKCGFIDGDIATYHNTHDAHGRPTKRIKRWK